MSYVQQRCTVNITLGRVCGEVFTVGNTSIHGVAENTGFVLPLKAFCQNIVASASQQRITLAPLNSKRNVWVRGHVRPSTDIRRLIRSKHPAFPRGRSLHGFPCVSKMGLYAPHDIHALRLNVLKNTIDLD